MTDPKTVLVTGASGFIAKHICLRLLNAGYRVVGSVRSEDRGRAIATAVRPHLASDRDLDSRLRTVVLDLASDNGWEAATNGADMLIHTASPFPLEQPKNADDLIKPAVDGTLRAFTAAKAAGIGRVVMTSSTVAVMTTDLPSGRTEYDESDWSDLDHPAATPYAKSKTLAERAAWDFVAREAPDMGLTVINPAFVLGPPLDDHLGTSMLVVQRLLRSRDPALPNFGFASVDVRDIAEMHVRALTTPESIGKRIIGADRFFWYIDMAKTLATAYPDRKITTRRAPNWLVRVLAVFDKPVRSIVPNLDAVHRLSNARAKEVLGMAFIDVEDSLRASADFLVKRDLLG